MKGKKIIPIFAVLLVGVVLGFFIIRADKTSIGSDSHEGAESEQHEEGESGHMEGEHAEGEHGEGEHAGGEGKIELSSEAALRAGIEIKTAGPARMKMVLELPGEISLNRNKVAHVVPRLSGVVTEVRKNLGDPVKRGEVIAVIDSRELADAKSAYLAAGKRLELAQSTFEREKQLFEKKISPEQDFLASKQALAEAEIEFQTSRQKMLALGLSQADLERLSERSSEVFTHYEIRSPFDGVVIQKEVAVGEAIKEDADIFVIADLSTVWGEFTVYANDLDVIKQGQKVTVRAKTLKLEAAGRVSYLGPLVGEQTRSAKARVDIPNPKGVWRPGLFVTAEVVQEEVPVPVAVPVDAIQTVEDRPVVFVHDGDHFEARTIELGRRDRQWAEIVSGLSPGESYAARNSFALKAELGKGEATHSH